MYRIYATCKGGGYIYCRTIPLHPKANANGLYPLHRVLVENKLGRHLKDDEHVHHLDGDKNNNCVDNLIAMTASEHAAHHRRIGRRLENVTCANCEKNFTLKPHLKRLRLKRNVMGKLFCSISCGASYQNGWQAR